MTEIRLKYICAANARSWQSSAIIQMVTHYTKRANQCVLAGSAMDRVEAAESGKPKDATGVKWVATPLF